MCRSAARTRARTSCPSGWPEKNPSQAVCRRPLGAEACALYTPGRRRWRDTEADGSPGRAELHGTDAHGATAPAQEMPRKPRPSPANLDGHGGGHRHSSSTGQGEGARGDT
ncbi:hypothetical protein ColTof4_11525 [Colletotrichum tofieldiae]|nr:hypothetical protein ColTof3_04718 [Colletotrichum tofieldiae]GKT79102.1 hypothetical protein ColTof4_11525 [Colletotrichum tofieldiae]